MNFEFYATFPELYGEDAAIFGTFMIVYLVIMLLTSAYSILVYVLQSLGLYSISKRRGIHHPWLSWLPVGNMWILGSIADQYQYVAKGKVRNRRKTLLGLTIAMIVSYILFIITFVVFILAALEADRYGGSATGILGPTLLFLAVDFVFVVLSVILAVVEYIASYDLFASCTPKNAAMFLVLSIVFSFTWPFFIFALRKKDEGMPPRRPRIPEAPWQPAPPPSAPTWQQPAASQPWQPPVPPVQQPWQPPVPPVQQPAEAPAPESAEE